MKDKIQYILFVIALFAVFFIVSNFEYCSNFRYINNHGAAYDLVKSMRAEYKEHLQYTCDLCGKDAFYSLNFITDDSEILCVDCAVELISHIKNYEEDLCLIDYMHSTYGYSWNPFGECARCHVTRPPGELLLDTETDSFICTHCLYDSGMYNKP